MTDERYKQLNDLTQDPLPLLTPEEFAEGWHYCAEFDALLVGPGMGELDCCGCFPKEHPVYKTIPPIENMEVPLC